LSGQIFLRKRSVFVKHCEFRIALVILALAAVFALAAFGCAPARPATPAVPAVPSAPSIPTTPAPAVQGTPPPAQTTPPQSNVPLPVVDYFISSGDNLPPGTLAILIWNVAGADSVSIDNGIGRVDPQGRRTVLLSASVTFVLTATSRGGSVTARVPIEVSTLFASAPHYRPGYSLSNVQTTAVVGSAYAIKQDTMTSRGYRWVVDYYDPAMLKYTGSNYIELNPLTRGVDGQTQFIFEPLETGYTKVIVSLLNDATPTQFQSLLYSMRVLPR
jgi:hypothetical protein